MTSANLMQEELFAHDNCEVETQELVTTGEQSLPQAELSWAEQNHIEKLLVDNFLHKEGYEDEIVADIGELKRITAEIKTIGKQSIILQGERIFSARKIFKKYGNSQSTFTQWIEKTYPNRRTAYNILSYYELFCTLPSENLRQKMRSMPLQAVYTLASRDGSQEVKCDVIRNYEGEKQQDIIMLIQDRLPLSGKDRRKRKEANLRLKEDLQKLSETLERRKSTLSAEQRKGFREVLDKMQTFLH